MRNDNKVLACVDRSDYAQTVADYAAWAAARLGAPLELLHVIDPHPALTAGQDHSGAIGANAQQELLDRYAAEEGQRNRAAREAGRVFLNALRERSLAAGAAPVDMRQCYGEVAQTLQEQQSQVRLIVLGRRGASTPQAARDLGGHVEWVVRSAQRPILIVTGSFQPPTRVLFAFDGSSVTRRGVEMIAASPLLKGLPVQLLMAGQPSGQAGKELDWACQTLQAAGLNVSAECQPGEPTAVIPSAIQQQGFDLLVMGAYSHSPWRKLLLGSRTSELLKSSTVPTLLLR